MRLVRNNKGLTLIEVMVATGVSTALFASVLAVIVVILHMNALAKHYSQAVQVVRGGLEEIKKTPFNNIQGVTVTEVAYDAGENGIFGGDDDLVGQLTITVADFLDMDNDGNTVEDHIDIDGDGVNDCLEFGIGGGGGATCVEPYAKPIHIEFEWTATVMGQERTFTVSSDTVIAR